MAADVVDTRARRTRARHQALAVEYHLLLLLTLGLVAFGLIMVYSASSGVAVVNGQDPISLLEKQGEYAVIGIAMMAFAARIPYRRWRPLVPLVMLLSLVLLVVVLIPGIGLRLNGARRWVGVGGLTIQPSEIAKLAMLLFACQVLAARRRAPQTFAQLVSPVGVVATTVCVLVLAEPDLGTTIAITLMVAGVLVVAGTRLRLLAATAVGMVSVAVVGISSNGYMRARLTTFLDPWHAAGGAGYQSVQGLYALGSGGIWGKGLGQGTVKLNYLPEAPSDMIAAVIGEELGLIGIVFTAVAFAAFAVLGFRIAMRCKEPFGKYLATGITCLVTGQAIVNLGAVLGFLPLTGVPLPLISSGGSSLVVFLTMAGIMLSIAEGDRAGASARAGRARDTADDAAPPAKPAPKPRPRTRAAAGADRSRGNGGARGAGAGGGRRAHG